MLEGLGDRFQRESKYIRGESLVGGMSWENLPEPYKFYTNVQVVNLPEPKYLSGMSFNEALLKRKSIREYSLEPIQLDQISYILWAANGIRSREENQNFVLPLRQVHFIQLRPILWLAMFQTLTLGFTIIRFKSMN